MAHLGDPSSILAVGGSCPNWGNLAVRDLLARVPVGPAAMQAHHTALVTPLQVCAH